MQNKAPVVIDLQNDITKTSEMLAYYESKGCRLLTSAEWRGDTEI